MKDNLRERAEKKLRANKPRPQESPPPEETRRLLHEVKVHLIEQEMQNEELRRVQEELETARARYCDLYDLAPVGYFVLNEKGAILEANLRAATLFGTPRVELLKSALTHWIVPEDQDIYYRHRNQLSKTGEPLVCELRLVSKNAAPFWARLEGTAAEAADGASICRVVLSDITARKMAEERQNDTLQRLRQAMASTIRVLGLTVEARDPYTAGHQQKTTILAEAIAREMGLPPEKIEGLHMAGLVHDVGKISIPAEILSKPTNLTPGEYELVKTHPRRGFEILKDVEFPWPLAEIIHQHHERMDGSGYPRGLKRDEILMEARILALADTVEAMVSDRPYRPALGLKAALAEIEGNKGILYDTDVAETCLKLFRENRFSFPA